MGDRGDVPRRERAFGSGRASMQGPQGGGAYGADDPISSCDFMDVGRASKAWASGGFAESALEPVDTKSVVRRYY